MGNNRIYLADWNYDGDRVRLLYSDGDVIYVTKEDFERTTKTFIDKEKDIIVRDFAIKDGEE